MILEFYPYGGAFAEVSQVETFIGSGMAGHDLRPARAATSI